MEESNEQRNLGSSERSLCVVILIVSVLLVGLIYLSKKHLFSKNSSSSNQLATLSPTPNVNNEFVLSIKDKKLVTGTSTISVTEGDKVILKITSDEDQELHLHGYDLSIELKKDNEVVLSFDAKITGHFIYELEQSKTDLGAIDVLPK